MLGARFRRDQEGMASGVVAFLMAGLIFTGSIGAVLIMSRDSGTGVAASSAPVAALNTQAKSLAQFLLDSPGVLPTSGDWMEGTTAASASNPKADALKRLGLKDGTSTHPFLLNFSKFENLRLAPFAKNASDGYVNYEEARTGLGLDKTGLDFHIRAYPTLRQVQEILDQGVRDPNLRVTYLGHIGVSNGGGPPPPPPPPGPTPGLSVSTPTCAVSPLPKAYRISSTVTNGGNASTQFSATWTINLNGQGAKTYFGNTDLVPKGATGSLTVDIPAYGGKTCATANTTLSLSVSDPARTLLSLPASAPDPGPTNATAASKDLTMEVSKPFYVITSGSCASGAYLNYNGDNLVAPKPSKPGDQVVARIFNGTFTGLATGTPLWTSKVPTANPDDSEADVGNNDKQRKITFPCLPAGTYTVFLYLVNTGAGTTDYDNHIQVRRKFLVVNTTPSNYVPPAAAPPPVSSGPNSYTPTEAVGPEVAYLRTLVKRFCPSYFDNKTLTPLTPNDWDGDGDVDGNDTWNPRCGSFAAGRNPSQPGDVFPDDKKIMNDEQNGLRARLVNLTTGLPRYDVTQVLVVGSNVDQNAMTSAAAKDAVRDWVLGGGTLIVFGSGAQNVNWLEPLFHAAIRSSSGGLSVPDVDHPLLRTADELDYRTYDNDDRVWNFNGQTAKDADKLFTNIAVQGSDPITAESNAGAMGKGSVILSTWRPYALNSSQSPGWNEGQGLKLMNNILMQGYRDLFLDYGPSLPPRTNVIPAVREMQICHPAFLDALGECDPIQLSVRVFVFK